MFRKIFFIIIQLCSDFFLFSNFVQFNLFLNPFFLLFDKLLVGKVLFSEPFKKNLTNKVLPEKIATSINIAK